MSKSHFYWLTQFLTLFVLLGFNINAVAQCPVINNCTPGSAPTSAFPFGMGIYNVVLGSGSTGFTNPTTGGGSSGYQDYSCSKKAQLLEGTATPITINTNINVSENVRIWIDYNNNGTFEPATELAFSSNNAKVHTGNITVPLNASVVKNTLLRMRISADNFSSAIPTPCSTPAYSQVEDYGVTIISNVFKPATDFIVNKPVTCAPTVQFQNLTQFGATTYLWSFGDNTTSTASNPSHTYANPGTYTVKLKACNANGCDSVTKINYVTYHTNVPVAATCTPTTLSYCCDYGINQVTFHTMVNASRSGVAGYEDFTCAKSVTVAEGQSYPLFIETGAANLQDTWVYIDYNNNGTFETAELVFSKLNYKNPTANIVIPTGKIINIPLRMRVISDAQGSSNSGACTNLAQGQAEDYTIIINRPALSVTSNFTNICNSQVQFNGISTGSPGSWYWEFGDGTTSTIQNPVHNYGANGSYTVKLKACSGLSCDSVIKTNYIVVNKPCPVYCTPVVANNNPLSIIRVQLNSLDNVTAQEPNGYGNYTRLATSLTKGNYCKLAVTANSSLAALNKIIAWIDYNRDGDFNDQGEEIANNVTNNLLKTIFIPATATTGVTRMRVLTLDNSVNSNPCPVNLVQGEVEDYSIVIKAVSQKPVPHFGYTVNPCSGLSFLFSDSSANIPTTRLWKFGDQASGLANSSMLQNPSHAFSGAGTYMVQLKTCNAFGCDSVVKIIAVQANSVPLPLQANCTPANNLPAKNGYGIKRVSLHTLNNVTSGNADGYKDYTCSGRTVLEQQDSYMLTVETAPLLSLYEQVRVWIDYNNDGFYNLSDELVLSSSDSLTHFATVVPPLAAVLNQPLRMRVINKFSSNFLLNPLLACALPDTGEVEDYTVTIVPFTDQPVVYFKQDARTGCNTPIQFIDSSAYAPTSWSWNFGDPASGAANYSNLKNPAHTFSGPGTYSVSLTACNSNGCNALTKSSWITVLPNVSISPALCKPQTLNYCCSEGIKSITSSGFYNASGAAWEGYQDFTCTTPWTFPLTNSNNLIVETFSTNERVKAWLDFNNDGFFEAAEEATVYHTVGDEFHNVVFNVPITVVTGTRLRMRIMSERMGFAFPAPCTDLTWGQAEDYAVIISPPAPTPLFSYSNNCSGTIPFTDLTTNSPTSWLWDFGDPASGSANSSTLQNPSHTFSGTGHYLVILEACNATGCNTYGMRFFVGLNPGISIVPACIPSTFSEYLYKVTLGTINNNTNAFNDGGYMDYSCQDNTILNAGSSYPINITTGGSRDVQVWIDYDNNGVFSSAERVMVSLSKVNHAANIIPPVSAVKNTYLRMRVMASYHTATLIGPCPIKDYDHQAEDYGVKITGSTGIVEADFEKEITLYPNPGNGEFSLSFPNGIRQKYALQVMNLVGQTLATEQLQPKEGIARLDLRYLPKCIYLIRIYNDQVSAVKRLIIE